MTDELVQRLRYAHEQVLIPEVSSLFSAAADRIEQLEAQLAERGPGMSDKSYVVPAKTCDKPVRSRCHDGDTLSQLRPPCLGCLGDGTRLAVESRIEVEHLMYESHDDLVFVPGESIWLALSVLPTNEETR